MKVLVEGLVRHNQLLLFHILLFIKFLFFFYCSWLGGGVGWLILKEKLGACSMLYFLILFFQLD